MRVWVAIVIVVASARAFADAPGDDLPAARAVGRAGTGLVSDDGAGALIANPGALARRGQARGQASLVSDDQDLSYATGSITIGDQASGALAPAAAAEDAIGDALVVGAGYATTAAWTRALPVPAGGQPAMDVAKLYPHRYAGLGGSFTRRTVAAALAWRATDSLAIGASARLDQVSLDERRRLWAGFAGRDDANDPTRDVDLQLRGSDGVVPGGAIGALFAPTDAPIELAVAAGATAPAHLDGDVTAAQVGAPTVEEVAPSARIDLPASLTVRAGARFLAERWTLEIGGDLALAPARSEPTWAIEGVRVIDPTTKVAADLTSVPSLYTTGAHGSARAAVDVEIAEGLCWLTAGYAWSSRSTPLVTTAPVFAELGGHTAAAGLELTAQGFTITAGWSRTFAATAVIDQGAVTQVNPFAAGAAVANLGTYTTDRDLFALSVELALD
ncbi:MAG TPA: hypothetical protein VL463_03415 [Kofleriaceae bacterium]|nr:hypothetical protein [Kofleriaceae bacterium]